MAAASRPGLRVLIGDGDRRFAEGMRALLRTQPGVDMAAIAADGPAVVELAGELKPDVVLIDPALAGESAATVVGKVRETAPVVAMLADEPEALLCGASAFVRKADAPALLGVLREIVRLSPASAPA